MTAAIASPPINRQRRAPYLAPVPDSEPPFDDEPAVPRAPLRPAPARPAATELAGQPPAPSLPAPGAARIPAPAPAADNRQASSTPVLTQPLTQDQASPPTGSAATAVPSGPKLAGPKLAEPRRTENLPPWQLRQPPHERPAGLRRTSASPTPALPASPPGTARPTTITAVGVPEWSSESDIGIRRTATEHLPPATRAASVFARALVEVLSGQRPLAQLRVHCSPEIYAGLAQRPATAALSLPHLLTVRVCEPADGVAEVSAAFRRADRVRALAFRIQGVDGRWRITALQLG